MNNTSSTPELHLEPCDGQDLNLVHNDFAVPQPTDSLPVTTIKLSDTTGGAFDPMGTLPPGLVAELNALKDGDPNTEITLTIYRGRCKMEVYL